MYYSSFLTCTRLPFKLLRCEGRQHGHLLSQVEPMPVKLVVLPLQHKVRVQAPVLNAWTDCRVLRGYLLLAVNKGTSAGWADHLLRHLSNQAGLAFPPVIFSTSIFHTCVKERHLFNDWINWASFFPQQHMCSIHTIWGEVNNYTLL